MCIYKSVHQHSYIFDTSIGINDASIFPTNGHKWLFQMGYKVFNCCSSLKEWLVYLGIFYLISIIETIVIKVSHHMAINLIVLVLLQSQVNIERDQIKKKLFLTFKALIWETKKKLSIYENDSKIAQVKPFLSAF